jgi:hypothetical protein
MSSQWGERREQWRRYAIWESGLLASEAAVDFSAALDWMSQARELAQRAHPTWDSESLRQEHWDHLANVRRALARLRPAA